MRQQFLEALLFGILTEKVPFSNRDDEISLKSVVRLENISDLILHHLAENKAAWTLTCHDGALSKDRIWEKIGAYHGGGSLKLSFKLSNVAHSNLNKNTIPFLVAAVKDSASNVATLLQPYSRQIDCLP